MLEAILHVFSEKRLFLFSFGKVGEVVFSKTLDELMKIKTLSFIKKLEHSGNRAQILFSGSLAMKCCTLPEPQC